VTQNPMNPENKADSNSLHVMITIPLISHVVDACHIRTYMTPYALQAPLSEVEPKLPSQI